MNKKKYTSKGSKAEFGTLPIHEYNPFEAEGIEYRSYITKEGEDIGVGKETNDLYIVKKIPRGKKVLHDSKPYTKFFIDAAFFLRDLSVPASNLLYLIISRLTINATEICVAEEDFMDHCGYKPNSRRLYYQAATELIERGVIMKKAGYRRCYWVNPNVIFNGDRTKVFKP